ncbi:MAG: heparinase II/III family protein [Verrucomicrobia bacterium]|nr:heparinase II/III family protein [Verrucomicrobiota bacterium]
MRDPGHPMADRLRWYWHRLRAMSLGEVFQHGRRRWRVLVDERRHWDWGIVSLGRGGTFPRLAGVESAPAGLREILARDAEEIRKGHWRAFGHLKLKVEVPPRWHCDYLAGQDLATGLCSSRLEYRKLPGGADIKLIWELSRWTQLTRLAMAAYVLEDRAAAGRCEQCLWDWLEHNPPHRGWNWTSALEGGIRLVQLAWMDALLAGRLEAGLGEEAWGALMARLLPAHVHYVWRHRSFGSSANNHLLGELAGLMVATVRWPRLARWGASLETLKALLEREVLAQFAEDGGNREQALNYQLFAFELCWQARMALMATGRKLVPAVEERLARAAGFFLEVQVEHEPWDYGDSDSAYVLPAFARETTALREWRAWFARAQPGAVLDYWLGDPPVVGASSPSHPAHTIEAGDWWIYARSGMGICESGLWFLRWDMSPLGYLRTAAHGHLDALHLSIWHRGVAMVIDPGTGAYYGDRGLRARLASREAHNGPCPEGDLGPRRLGPFLWSEHHPVPTWQAMEIEGSRVVRAELQAGDGVLRRSVRRLTDPEGWEVADEYMRDGDGGRFSVLWQFEPGARLRHLEGRRFRLQRGEVKVEVEVGEGWSEIAEVENPVSPAFRQVTTAPGLRLMSPDKPCVLRTRFLACGGS